MSVCPSCRGYLGLAVTGIALLDCACDDALTSVEGSSTILASHVDSGRDAYPAQGIEPVARLATLPSRPLSEGD